MAVPDPSQPPPSSRTAQPSSSHRLPTVSATQALQSLQTSGPRSIPSGLKQLDALLGGLGVRNGFAHASTDGGYARGTVTEIWGPSGSGKTTLCMQAGSNALSAGDEVVWIDASTRMIRPRFDDIRRQTGDDNNPATEETRSDQTRFHHFATPTLAHLLALLLHPPDWFPPSRTSLLVIDDLHSLIDVAYPRYSSASTSNGSGSSTRSEAARWIAGRRFSVLGTFVSALRKLAAVHDMAILVTTGCATRVRPGTGLGAVLVPGLSGAEWEAGISNRMVLFRDYGQGKGMAQDMGKSARFVGVQKVQGTSVGEEGDVGQAIRFGIGKHGITEPTHTLPVKEDGTLDLPRPISSPLKTRKKRKYGEVADSDEEISSEYGWVAEDEVAAEGLIDEEVLVVPEEEAEENEAKVEAHIDV